MELTPETFEKQEFTERRKGGYDIDEVETFLEEAGTELAQMLARVRHTEERAAHAESRLSQADAVLQSAEERIRRAEEAAQRSAQQAAQSLDQAGAASRLSEEAEVEQAAKTLLMAKRTAEATVAEARSSSQTLLSESKSRADRQLADAHAEAEELLRGARVQAEQELDAARGGIMDEVRALEARRAQLADVINQLEARLAGYRSELGRTARELTELASDPERLGSRPTMSIPPDEVISGSHAEVVDPEAAPDNDHDGDDVHGGDASGSGDRVSAPAEPMAQAAHVDEPLQAASVVAEPEPEPGPGPDVEPEPESDVDMASGEIVDLTGSHEVVEETWGPGTWAEVAASLDAEESSVGGSNATTTATRAPRAESTVDAGVTEASANTAVTTAVSDATERPADAEVEVDSRPTQAVPVAEPPRDRFMHELDQAVNAGGEESSDDEAMTAFFEGTSETRARRFGWRR